MRTICCDQVKEKCICDPDELVLHFGISPARLKELIRKEARKKKKPDTSLMH
jgi:hypothetical protein